MMLIVKQIFALIRLLNSEKGETSIASGLALGLIAGLIPSNPVILAAILFVFCVFRINGGAFFLSWAFFSVMAFPLDGWFDRIGYWFLRDVKPLLGMWTQLYNMPVVPWTSFFNTVVAGSLLVGVGLFVPVLVGSRKLVLMYRKTLRERVQRSHWMRMMKGTTLYKLYEKYSRIRATLS